MGSAERLSSFHFIPDSGRQQRSRVESAPSKASGARDKMLLNVPFTLLPFTLFKSFFLEE